MAEWAYAATRVPARQLREHRAQSVAGGVRADRRRGPRARVHLGGWVHHQLRGPGGARERLGTPVGETAAQESTDSNDLRYKAPTLPGVTSPQPMLLRLMAGTAVVLVLCVGSLWGARGWLAPHQNAAAGHQAVTP